MNRTLSAITAVCVVCAAAKSKAEVNILGGSLHHWQSIEEVGTTYKENYSLGKDKSGGEVPASVSMTGIEKALMVATGLIRSDSDVTQTIRQFTSKGHREYNKNGNPNSQNFVVMVVKLAGMIAKLEPYGMICPDRVCEHCLTVTANGQPKWWQIVGEDEDGKPIIKNEDHDAIRDCELYIENFKIKEYLDDVRGTIFYMTCSDSERQNAYSSRKFWKSMDVKDGDSNIEAAYQIMALLPKYYEEAEKAMENIDQAIALNKDPQDESDELEAARAHKDLIGASLIAITGVYARGVGTKLMSSMLQTAINAKIIEKEETPLQIIKKTVELVSKYNEDSRVKQNLYAQQKKEATSKKNERRPDRTDKLEDSAVDDITFIDGTEVLWFINQRYACQFGEYPVLELESGKYKLATDVAFALDREIGDALRCQYHIPYCFFWDDSDLMWLRDNEDDKSLNASVKYILDAIIVLTNFGGTKRYMTAREIKRKLGAPVINGRECLQVFNRLSDSERRATKELGEVCAVFYRRVVPQPGA